MRKSIYFKNFITTAAIVLTSFVILGAVFSVLSYRFVMNEKRQSMSSTANEVVRSVSAYNLEWDLDSLEVRMALSVISNISGYDIIISDLNGIVLSSSDRRIDSPYIGKSISGEILNTISFSGQYSGNSDLGEVYEEPNYIVGVTLTSGRTGDISGYVFLSSNSGSMSQIWRQFAGIFFMVAVAVMFLTLITSLITTKKQAKPINEMAVAAHKFAKGDFSVRIADTGREDEIGALAEAFNTMAHSLERSENLRREFIANVSHELKTPMTTITGFADGILDGTIPPENQNKYLRVISSETRRLSRLVRSMLEMSHIQAMDASSFTKNNFDISEVIRLALLSLESKITNRGLDVEMNLPEEPIMTRGDKDSITQVIYNLIDNAIKFADSDSAIILSLWKQGGKAYISVENTGATIDSKELPLIFDRFHKSDRSRSMDRDGVGLGLYIVKTILDNHNENIHVTSQNGVTKFLFTLTIS